MTTESRTGIDRALVLTYAAVALLAFVSTQMTLVAHFADGRGLTDFVTDPLETPAGVFFGIDLLAVALVGLVFMLAEARRIGLRHAWIYVALTFLVAISVSFPLFLMARQRHLGHRGHLGRDGSGHSVAAS
ncbi:hypothetical protein ASE01_11170 [Nocardioides sp. Root190]|uniref:DUF2834 domain-containing protein n=1 Tax=Nocardioides sp. Root190 TaxID=1736488 RepID=UPI0007013C49|nr:DUF2834 domain-containing protein [Nocardioides sp. Root190]KRB77290.1 hypothetical protein ASE01_11170 [Nocardioides sp. Root190]